MDKIEKNRYKQNYNKENYKEIRFWFAKGQIDTAEASAKAHGYDTLNAYAKALLDAALAGEIELNKDTATK